MKNIILSLLVLASFLFSCKKETIMTIVEAQSAYNKALPEAQSQSLKIWEKAVILTVDTCKEFGEVYDLFIGNNVPSGTKAEEKALSKMIEASNKLELAFYSYLFVCQKQPGNNKLLKKAVDRWEKFLISRIDTTRSSIEMGHIARIGYSLFYQRELRLSRDWEKYNYSEGCYKYPSKRCQKEFEKKWDLLSEKELKLAKTVEDFAKVSWYVRNDTTSVVYKRVYAKYDSISYKCLQEIPAENLAVNWNGAHYYSNGRWGDMLYLSPNAEKIARKIAKIQIK